MATVPISDTSTRNDYTSSASQTTFAYTFWIKDEDHLDVYVNDTLKTLTTDYTVSATQSVTGANVVFNTGLNDGDTVAIVYNPDVERASEFQTSGSFKATSLNLELTYLVSLMQYVVTQLGRKFGLADTVDSSATLTIPDPSGNGGKAVTVNSAGDGFEYTTVANSTAIGNFETLVTDGDNSTVTFALGFTPVSVNSILVEVDGVLLEPTVDYTVATTNITFTTAPSTGTDNIIVKNLASGVAATTPADSSVTTAKIQDAAVTTAKLASNSVDGTKIAVGSDAQGDILYYNGTDYTRLGAGTNGQFLKTQGTGANPTWANAGGGLVFLSSATASASSSIDFTSSIDSTYDTYIFIVNNIELSIDGAQLQIRTSTDGGSTFDSGAGYEYAGHGIDSAGNGINTLSQNDIAIVIVPDVGSAAGEYVSAVVYLHTPSSAQYTYLQWGFTVIRSGGTIHTGNGAGARKASEDVDALRFLASVGNLDSGTIRMYGVVKS